MSTSSVVKKSVSFKTKNREQLEHVKNKSKVVNQALELFFHKEKLRQQAEEKRLEKMAQEGLESVRKGEVFELKTKGKVPTKKELREFLRGKK